MRANMSGALGVDKMFWPLARAYAAVQHMVTINDRRGKSPTKALTGHDASLYPMLPWGAWIAVLALPTPSRVVPRAVVARYLGAAPKYGSRAVHFIIDPSVGGRVDGRGVRGAAPGAVGPRFTIAA